MYPYKITYFILDTILLTPIVIYNLVAITIGNGASALIPASSSLVLWRLLVKGVGYQPPVVFSSPMQSVPLIKKPFSELRYLLMDLFFAFL